MNVLAVEDVGISFGSVVAVDGVTFAVRAGEIFSIIGPNGAGKTTLFNVISGVYKPHRGRIFIAGEEATGLDPHRLAAKGVARTFQNLQIFFRMSIVENVMAGRHLRERYGLLAALMRLPSVGRQNRATRETALHLLEFVGLTGGADQPADALPYGALRRLEIARALALEPKILLLDEPAAGCNAVEIQEIERLVREIARQGVTIVLVEHDVQFVMRISDRVLVLDRGQILAEGTAAEIRRNPEVIRAYLGRHGEEEGRCAVD